MSDLAFGSPGENDAAGQRGSVVALRTLLVGDFSPPHACDRPTLEAVLATSSADRMSCMTFTCGALDPVEHAETQLAYDAVDVVLMDLHGPVSVILSLVGRLRAAAGEGVVFIGILSRPADAVARLYLSAVVDAVIGEPLRPASAHRVIAEALQGTPSFPGIFFCPPTTIGSTVRH